MLLPKINLRKHHTEETKRKMSEMRKGKKLPPFSEEHKRKISNTRKKLGLKPTLGKHWKLSEKTKRKMSESAKGRPFPYSWKNKKHSEETKKKMSESAKGNQHWLGKKHSLKTRKKMSAWQIGKHHSEETKKKLSEYKGEKSANWHGGKSFEPYTLDWTRSLKISIRERDYYTCQLCGKKQGDRAFSIHHIDYDKKNCDPKNLITLCVNCHSKTNTNNREYWTKYFYQKLNNIDYGIFNQ